MDLLQTATDIATIVGIIIGLVTLAYAVRQFGLSQLQLRGDLAERSAEHFLKLRERFKGDQTLRDICTRLEEEAVAPEGDEKARSSAALSAIPFEDKRTFLGLLEEVALLVNSKFISMEIAHYMFGYYVLECADSPGFWSDPNSPNEGSAYWKVFFDFAESLRPYQGEFLSIMNSDEQATIQRYIRERLVFR